MALLFELLISKCVQAAEACQLKLRSIGTKPEHIADGKIISLGVVIVSISMLLSSVGELLAQTYALLFIFAFLCFNHIYVSYTPFLVIIFLV